MIDVYEVDLSLIITARKRSCGKVMFSQASAIHKGGGLPRRPRQTPPPRHGQLAGGTQPTEMHTCFHKHLFRDPHRTHETETDEMDIEPIGNLLVSVFVQCEHLKTILHTLSF